LSKSKLAYQLLSLLHFCSFPGPGGDDDGGHNGIKRPRSGRRKSSTRSLPVGAETEKHNTRSPVRCLLNPSLLLLCRITTSKAIRFCCLAWLLVSPVTRPWPVCPCDYFRAHLAIEPVLSSLRYDIVINSSTASASYNAPVVTRQARSGLCVDGPGSERPCISTNPYDLFEVTGWYLYYEEKEAYTSC
jgi:hypothetical protein